MVYPLVLMVAGWFAKHLRRYGERIQTPWLRKAFTVDAADLTERGRRARAYEARQRGL